MTMVSALVTCVGTVFLVWNPIEILKMLKKNIFSKIFKNAFLLPYTKLILSNLI